jgi:hypothetical protein
MKVVQQSLSNQLSKLLDDLKESKLSELDKKFVMGEAKSTYDDILKYGPLKQEISGSLTTNIAQTRLYADSFGPVVLAHGNGPVGEKMKDIAKTLGKSANIRLLDADAIGSMRDSELNFAVREANTVIIAADSPSEESKGFFGSSSPPERKYCMDAKNLKKLLNAVMNDQKRRYVDQPAKIMWYGSAIKQQKSIASFLTGDTTDMDSEFILQCQQRGLRYLSVLTGGIISDDAPYPSSARRRSSYEQIDSSSSSDASKPQSQSSSSSVLVLMKKSVEASECTRVSVASEALYRAASHPNGNSTITVLSTESNQAATDEIWDDEFQKIDGPELMRVKLNYASPAQVASRLGRILPQLSLPGSGIITPIEVTRYTNGARIIFVPKAKSYESSREEKKRETDYEKQMTNELKAKSKYIPPERDADALKPLEENLPMKSKVKPKKPEGGIEVFIDKEPVSRVRLRRCNMGPETIIKEESEALIVKEIVKAIRILENDCRILLKTQEQTV